MILDADLHIHSPFSMAVSASMTPAALLDACRLKGLGALGTGDALHPEWRDMWLDYLEGECGVVIIPSAEVETKGRIHHLILMEHFAGFEELAELLRPYSRDLDRSGRPHVKMSGELLAAYVHEAGGMLGPAHAFTPWTSLFAAFDRVHDCYGEEGIDFLELGLSADSSYGARIPELEHVPFLSNSDAHSPTPLKIGREFSRLEVDNTTPRGILDAITRNSIALNAGFFPEEGKYNRTACIHCYRQYPLEDAVSLDWKCPFDGKRLKKGVMDRASELGTGTPLPRPPYLHLIPLGEIIQKITGTSSPSTKKCRNRYDRLIEALGPEIRILVDIPVEEIREVDPGIADALFHLRNGNVLLHPGGGGRYGSFEFP